MLSKAVQSVDAGCTVKANNTRFTAWAVDADFAAKASNTCFTVPAAGRQQCPCHLGSGNRAPMILKLPEAMQGDTWPS
jgi:hypothetical protein